MFEKDNISYLTSRPLQDRTIDFQESRDIFKYNTIKIESSYYDMDTASITPYRNQYCECSLGVFLPINSKNLVGCQEWCCASSRKTTSYYPCEEKTQTEWQNSIGNVNVGTLGQINSSNGVRGVIRN